MMSRDDVNRLVEDTNREAAEKQKSIDNKIASLAEKARQREENEARERQASEDAVRSERKDIAEAELRAEAKRRLNSPALSDEEFSKLYPKLREKNNP